MVHWLPPHQEHLLYTLAHVDAVLDRVSSVIFEYVTGDVFGFANEVRDGVDHLTLASIAPIPEAVPRLTADAINQMRSAIEHALFAEVEFQMGRPLNSDEAQMVEMPAKRDNDNLLLWMRHKRRRTLTVLHEDSVLGKRIALLQPYHQVDQETHPLRILIEHSNFSKHRMPAVAAARVGQVIPEQKADGFTSRPAYEDDEVVAVGDVLSSVPLGNPVRVSIWPQLTVRRPHTGSWEVIIHELRELEEWTRTVAIPVIILGTTQCTPIHPYLDISVGHDSFETSMARAKPESAVERAMVRIKAKSLRDDLPGVFQEQLPDIPYETVMAFLSHQDDAEVVGLFERYRRVRSNRGLQSAIIYLRRKVGESMSPNWTGAQRK